MQYLQLYNEHYWQPEHTLLGYGAALPDTLASNQIVIGTQNETTFIGGGLLGGLTISGSSLTLVVNT